MKNKVILGMSGGVDSSVAAYILMQNGYEVTGAFMRNWDSAVNNDILGNDTLNDDVCPQEVDYHDAVKVAEKLGVPLKRIDFIDEYWNRVFSYFIEEYKHYRTPNPDILCNKNIKFDAFLKFALDENVDYIAMGHYAKVKHLKDKSYLLKAFDQNKDQTYFLCMLSQAQLRKSLFPLGDIDKKEVRKIAHTLDLATKDKKDSTGICFIGERNFKEFLKNYLPAQPGNIVSTEGVILGNHDGLMYYTIGQRKGLSIGGNAKYKNEPWFVVGKNLEKNELIVAQGANNELLYSTSCTAIELNEITDEIEVGKIYQAKVRYRGEDNPVIVIKKGEECLIKFINPIRSVTPGQAIVFYDGDICMGGAFINEVFYNDIKRNY